VRLSLSPFSMMNEAGNPSLKEPSNRSGSSSQSRSSQAIAMTLIGEMKKLGDLIKE